MRLLKEIQDNVALRIAIAAVVILIIAIPFIPGPVIHSAALKATYYLGPYLLCVALSVAVGFVTYSRKVFFWFCAVSVGGLALMSALGLVVDYH